MTTLVNNIPLMIKIFTEISFYNYSRKNDMCAFIHRNITSKMKFGNRKNLLAENIRN